MAFGPKNALGNYVHFLPESYSTFGTKWEGLRHSHNSVKNKTGKYYYNHRQAETWLNQQLSSIKIQESTVEELEKRLKFLTPQAGQKDKSTLNSNEKKMIQAVYEVLARTANINDIGRLSNDKNNIRNMKLTKGEYTKLLNGQYQNVEGNKKEFSKAFLGDAYKKVKEDYDQMMKTSSEQDINNFIQSMKRLLDKLDIKKMSTEFNNLDTNLQSLQGFIELYDLVNRYTTSYTTVKGNFGEVLVTFMDDAIYTKSHKTVNDYIAHAFMSGNWQGEKRSSFSLKPDELVGSSERKKQFITQDEYKTLYSIYSTQDKIDTSITVQGEEVGASVKTYGDFKKHPLEPQEGGIDLVSTLAYLNNQIPFFGTHWMNRHIQGSIESKDKIDKILEKFIVFQVFSTGTALKGSKGAKVLILFETTTGKVKVISIYNLLTKNYLREGVYFKGQNISDIVVPNTDFANDTKQPTMEEIEHRLINNIIQLHQIKLRVMYKPRL